MEFWCLWSLLPSLESRFWICALTERKDGVDLELYDCSLQRLSSSFSGVLGIVVMRLGNADLRGDRKIIKDTIRGISELAALEGMMSCGWFLTCGTCDSQGRYQVCQESFESICIVLCGPCPLPLLALALVNFSSSCSINFPLSRSLLPDVSHE